MKENTKHGQVTSGVRRKLRTQEYPPLHLLALPEKVLKLILQHLDSTSLIMLSEVNSQLYNIVSNDFLYRDVLLDSKASLLKFLAMIRAELHTADALDPTRSGMVESRNARFLVKSVEFVRPQCTDSLLKYSKFHAKDGVARETIAGAYTFDAATTTISTDSRLPTVPKNISFDDKGNANSYASIPKSSQTRDNRNSHFVKDREKEIARMESKFSTYTYIELMLAIIDYLPNLTKIILSEVEPGFKIPLWYSVFNDGSRDFFRKILRGQQSITNHDLGTFEVTKEFISDYESKFYSLPHVKTLEIRGSLDKRHNPQILLRPNLLCCFGIIQKLNLKDVIIDTESLDTPMEFIPLHLSKKEVGTYELHSPISSLLLTSCTIIPGNGILKLFHNYFRDVKNVELLAMKSKFDLLICNCFPALTNLTIDCQSKCFTKEQIISDNYYYTNPDEIQDEYELIDNGSTTETLFDKNDEMILEAPPPTSSIILAMNLNYISSTTGPDHSYKKKSGLLTKAQKEYFRNLNIPEFHYFYHYYKVLWDRLPHKNVNINVINIPFKNCYPLPPIKFWENVVRATCGEDDTIDQETLIAYTTSPNEAVEIEPDFIDGNGVSAEYPWDKDVKRCGAAYMSQLKNQMQYNDLDIEATMLDIDNGVINNFQNFKYFKDIPNINLWCFLSSLSRFKSVKVQLLKTFLAATPRSRYDWELLLRPVLKVNVPVEVRDRDGFILYSYGSIHKPSI